jgi:hypothetical protein
MKAEKSFYVTGHLDGKSVLLGINHENPDHMVTVVSGMVPEKFLDELNSNTKKLCDNMDKDGYSDTKKLNEIKKILKAFID